MMFECSSVSENGQDPQFVPFFHGEYHDYLCLYHAYHAQVLTKSSMQQPGTIIENSRTPYVLAMECLHQDAQRAVGCNHYIVSISNPNPSGCHHTHHMPFVLGDFDSLTLGIQTYPGRLHLFAFGPKPTKLHEFERHNVARRRGICCVGR